MLPGWLVGLCWSSGKGCSLAALLVCDRGGAVIC